jgi:hypothetical protein
MFCGVDETNLKVQVIPNVLSTMLWIMWISLCITNENKLTSRTGGVNTEIFNQLKTV